MSGIKLGVRSWTFRHALPNGGMSIEDLLHTVADMGLEGVEILARHFPRFTFECARSYRKTADSLGIKIAAYALENDFCFPDEKIREAELENAIQWVKMAAFSDVPFLKIFTGDRDESVSYGQQRTWLAGILRRLAVTAEAYGVIILVENHSTICFSWEELKDLVLDINHPFLRICPDVYNFSKYKAEEVVYQAARELLPYSPYGHLQFYEIDSSGKELHMDMKRLMDIYKELKYDGFLMLEWEGESDPFDATMRQTEYIYSIIH